ncbi:MAG: helix-turn-helix domain-containing protein [Spirochaetota bacterium]
MDYRDQLLLAVRTRIASRRLELGLSQETLAREAGLHRNTVAYYERGITEPTLCSITRILMTLGTKGLQFDDKRGISSLEVPGSSALPLSMVSRETALEVFGAAVESRRSVFGCSQECLAERMGCSRNTVGEIERGEVDPKITTILKIFCALNVSLVTYREGVLRFE